MEILERLQEIFREVFDQHDLQLREDTTSQDVEGWDSLAQVRLVFVVQERFGVEFSTEELTRLTSVRDFVETIRKHQ